MSEAERMQRVAKLIYEVPGEHRWQAPWEEANARKTPGYFVAVAGAAAALAWLGFDKCPGEGAVRHAIAILRADWENSRDGTNVEVKWEDWEETVRQALAALEGDDG